MENFVSVILNTKELDENAIVEAMLDALDAPLAERVNEYGLFESENDSVVLRLQTPYELDDDESDAFASTFANRMFEMGYDNFEIETSLEESLDSKLNAAIKKINSMGSMWKKVKQGSVNSPEVKTIQQALNKLGFDAGKADGWFGKNTAKAVMAFQKSKGLKVDGDPGPNTLKAMLNTVKDTSSADNQNKANMAMGPAGTFKDKDKPKSPSAMTNVQGLAQVDKSVDKSVPKSIANFDKVKTPKDVIKIGNDAIEKARQDGNLAQIAQIAAASLANLPNQLTPQQKADLSKELLSKLKPAELSNPKIKSALAPALLAVDVADAGVDEEALEKALQEFTRSTFPNAIPDRFRGNSMNDSEVERLSLQMIINKAQKEGLMSKFEDPAKAVAIIQDEVAKLMGRGKLSSKLDGKDGDMSSGGENVDVKKLADELFDAMDGIGTDEDQIADALKQIKNKAQWEKLQDTYEDEHRGELLADLRSELSFADFEEYVRNALPDNINVKYKEKRTRESVENFEETYNGDEFYEMYGWIGAPDEDLDLWEAEYRGRKVKLNKPMRGDVKKFKVYVKDPKTKNIKKVNFGDPNMKIKKSNPARRRSFRARHNCDNPGPRTKARYWSCRKW